MKKKISLAAILLLLVALPTLAKKNAKKAKYDTYAIAFYNQENLFDTKDDPGVKDEEFLPTSALKWDDTKYMQKINNMSSVLAAIATGNGLTDGAAIIGLAEVENRGVVEDLTHSKALLGRGYRILHFDSPDERGIDCAMLYDPRVFRLEDSLYVHNITPKPNSDKWLGFEQDPETKRIKALPLYGDTSHKTRGFLVGIGSLAGEKMAIIVCHWPSRGAESYTRESAGRQVKALTEALQRRYEGIKVVIMGDLNDDPDNKSLSKSMACKYKPSDITSADQIFNPWLYMLRTVGQGTLTYKGEWNLFDQIIMTGNMIDPKMKMSFERPNAGSLNLKGGLTYQWNEVVNLDFITQQQGKYKGTPKRSISGGQWQNGYSDHYPTCIYLVKKK